LLGIQPCFDRVTGRVKTASEGRVQKQPF
jgi:hypothetical protein